MQTSHLAPVIDDIFCNKCGSSCLKRVMPEVQPDFYGAHIEFSTGYMSTDFWDGHHFRFDLCEKCLKALMLSFLHPVETTEYFSNHTEEEGGWRPSTPADLRETPSMQACLFEDHGSYDHAKNPYGCPKCSEENAKREEAQP